MACRSIFAIDIDGTYTVVVQLSTVDKFLYILYVHSAVVLTRVFSYWFLQSMRIERRLIGPFKCGEIQSCPFRHEQIWFYSVCR